MAAAETASLAGEGAKGRTAALPAARLGAGLWGWSLGARLAAAGAVALGLWAAVLWAIG